MSEIVFFCTNIFVGPLYFVIITYNNYSSKNEIIIMYFIKNSTFVTVNINFHELHLIKKPLK